MKLAFVGDIMLGRLVNEELKAASPDYPWGGTLSVLHQADVRVGNLEFVLADHGEPWPSKAFNFRSDTKNVTSLKSAGFNLVSLANNHVLDYGISALEEMLAVLDREGIAHAGAGPNLTEASRLATWTHRQFKVGLIALTDNAPEWRAGTKMPGVYYLPISTEEPAAAELFALIGHARRQVDLLVISAHWGSNWGLAVPPEHRRFARALIDAGADIVYGHSAHIPRGVEVFRGRPIIYSAGDFVDDYAVDPLERNDQSFIYILETSQGIPHALHLYPSVIADYQAHLAGQDAQSIAAHMQKLSAELGTSSDWSAADNRLTIPLQEVAYAE